MQIVFFLIAFTGLVIFILGIKFLIVKYRDKILLVIKLIEGTNEINFENTGLYSVCIVGGKSIHKLGKFKIKISNDNGEEIFVADKLLKFTFDYKNEVATESFEFKIVKTGIHKLILKNIEDLEIKKSKSLSSILFEKKFPLEKTQLAIKETTSTTNFFIGLFMTLTGIFISIWSLILAFNPNIID